MLNRFTGNGSRGDLPLKRTGRPEEVAQTILFYGFRQASFITEQVVTVDGGKTAG